ncbi:MAG: DNA-directed RNA polymerase subunit omega [Firmicutes bacterium]|nr:DNA-directed RNA polymerase subunit omega [Bacillota bacterium]
MLYPKIEECVEKIGCKYTLTIVAAKRAKDLATKSPVNFQNSRTKEISFALREIAEGKVTVARVGTPVNA